MKDGKIFASVDDVLKHYDMGRQNDYPETSQNDQVQSREDMTSQVDRH